MSATGLKAPPRFVTNAWAWSYTLNKLAGKNGVDEYGNPHNYAAAIAIYKRVAAKYGDPGEPSNSHSVVPGAGELDVIDGLLWHTAHGCAWAANDIVTARLWCYGQSWYVEMVLDRGDLVYSLADDEALWLLKRSPAAVAWAQDQ